MSNRSVSDHANGEPKAEEKRYTGEAFGSGKLRLWLQYAGIVLVATAYIAGVIGWTYVSLNVENDASAAPLSRDIWVSNLDGSQSSFSAQLRPIEADRDDGFEVRRVLAPGLQNTSTHSPKRIEVL
ncbi:hypothetical protein CRI94_03145 [Longibacter salinarum]|uniref:Uncharacterized protein n=1 Tax=Longibacter salinarum TaxID=1850348 RepID=A0A2A8D327_9BACT|nr:hypothetical protein [Longibacter salinarum]PEN15290.1 hypothetical protein CRI94_03145 [Longibacter salinarum]